MGLSFDPVPPFDHDNMKRAFRITHAPNPGWTYGQRVEATPQGKAWVDSERAGWTVVDTAKENSRRLHAIGTYGIVPRPLAFVSSISEDGVENLAPFCWFNQVTPDPFIVSFSCSHKAGAAKDTLRNILSGTGFTINIVSEPWIEQANICATNAPFEVNEWPISGLTRAPSIHVKAPRVKESAFSMECELYKTIEITHPTTNLVALTLVLAHVKFIHMRNDVLDSERRVPDPGKLKPIAAMGGLTYARVTDVFSLPRESWSSISGDVRKALGDGVATADGLECSRKNEGRPQNSL